MVCTCSVVYMRAGIGNDRLVVCLSEYLPLCIVYRISSMSTIAYVGLVLVFAATPKEMALRSVFF